MSRTRRLVTATAMIITVIPLLIAAHVVSGSLRIGQQEHPPCRACGQIRNDVPRVTVCQLANNPQKYKGQLVRVAADFEHDAGQLVLRDGDCTMRTGFDNEKHACTGAWRRLQIICGIDGWYDSAAPVSVVGSLSKIPEGNYYVGEEGFTISCLEQVLIEPDSSQRRRFAKARLFRGLL